MSWEEQVRAEVLDVLANLFGLVAWLEALAHFCHRESVVCLARDVWHITTVPPPHPLFLQQTKVGLPWAVEMCCEDMCCVEWDRSSQKPAGLLVLVRQSRWDAGGYRSVSSHLVGYRGTFIGTMGT